MRALVAKRTRNRLLFSAVWLGAFALWEFLRIRAFLHGPPDPDLYANTWSFQIIVSTIFRLPVWVFLLIVVLLLESIYRGYRRESHANRAS
jgi:hypothetical protein